MQVTLILAIATTALIGPGAGMSLDQSIKQLPARRRIGIVAYSAYSTQKQYAAVYAGQNHGVLPE